MRPAKSRLCRILVPSALAFSLPWCTPAVFAGGGFSDPSFTLQSQTGATANYSARGNAVSADAVTITASGDGFNLTSTTGGIGGGGHAVSTVTMWDTTTVQTSVPANVTVDSNSYSMSFGKGTASLSWGNPTTEATVVINGKTYVVAKEVAIAFARGTQFGGSSLVEVEGVLSMPGNGYSTTPVAASKGTSR